jgi:hypothetical protein
MQDDDEAAFLAGADATPAPETPAAEPEKAAEAAPEAEEKPEATATPEEAETAADDADKPKQTPWFQKRIDELTREKHDARREAERLAQEISALRQPQTDDEGNPVQPPADPVAIARQMVEQQRFDDACNQIYEKGRPTSRISTRPSPIFAFSAGCLLHLSRRLARRTPLTPYCTTLERTRRKRLAS